MVLSLLAAVFFRMAWAGGPPKILIRVTLSPKTWTTVPLPAMTLGIAEHDGVLWVSGTNEMLARSDDQGRTWKMVHFTKDGQLLAAVAFAGNDGWAMGSQGVELHSDDDGAHWTQMSDAPGTVTRLVAADAQHLMAISPQGFLVSSNGGKQWLARGVPIPNQQPLRMNPVTGVAMPDADHAGALLDIPPTSAKSKDDRQLFVSTSDGGKTWRMIEFADGLHIVSLSSDRNGYMAPGSWQSEMSSKSVVFYSAGGIQWSMTPNKPSVYWCHRSECLLSTKSGWVNWDHDAATYWTTAAIPAMTNDWAAIPGVLCVVGDGLQCALAQRVAATPPEPVTPLAGSAGPSLVQVSAKVMAKKCLQCPPPWYPKIDRANRISGEVLLHAIIGKSGRVREVTLLAAPSTSLAHASLQAVRGWVYQPTLLNGHPVEVDTQVKMTFTLME